MQISTFMMAAAAAAGVVAISPRVAVTTGTSGPCDNCTHTAYVTQTVTAYETYCSKKTIFTQGTKTYTGFKKQWVTVTDCSPACTISNAVGAQPSVVPVGFNPRYANGTVPAETTAGPTRPATTPCPCAAINVAHPGSNTGSNTGNTCRCPVPNNGGNAGSNNGGNAGSNNGGNAGSNNGGNAGSNNGGNAGSNNGGNAGSNNGGNAPSPGSNSGSASSGSSNQGSSSGSQGSNSGSNSGASNGASNNAHPGSANNSTGKKPATLQSSEASLSYAGQAGVVLAVFAGVAALL